MQAQYYCYGCPINTTDFPVVNVYVTDFPVVKVHVGDVSSALIWQQKLCATLSANVNINYRLPIKVYYRICTLRRQPMLKLKIHSGFHDLFDSDMSKSTNTVVYFDWKTVIYIYVCGQCRTQFLLPNESRR
jgi:hypothetical protein